MRRRDFIVSFTTIGLGLSAGLSWAGDYRINSPESELAEDSTSSDWSRPRCGCQDTLVSLYDKGPGDRNGLCLV